MQRGNQRFGRGCVLRRLGATLCFVALFACTKIQAAPDGPAGEIEPPKETLNTPLRFKRHAFQALCYDTLDCSVAYNGRNQVRQLPGDAPNSKPAGDYRKTWGSVELDIRNFPAPAEIHWRSLDGQSHNARIDMRQIFKDELVWHRLRKDQMTDFYKGPVAGTPDIYLEVDDHTINVYMAMFIPTREEQVPGNKDSDFRKDVFLVWRRSY